jgi:hypothetical protein
VLRAGWNDFQGRRPDGARLDLPTAEAATVRARHEVPLPFGLGLVELVTYAARKVGRITGSLVAG